MPSEEISKLYSSREHIYKLFMHTEGGSGVQLWMDLLIVAMKARVKIICF
jgi:hypothetical protein